MVDVDPTDEEKLLHDILKERWDESKASLPYFYYDDSFKTADAKRGIIKIYYHDSPPIIPVGLGYGCKKVDFIVIIDVRGASRPQVLKMRDEIVRILDAVNVDPKRTTDTSSNYNYLVYSSGNKINAYADFYRWELYVTLKQLARPVGGI
jgi:hypothetical protein